MSRIRRLMMSSEGLSEKDYIQKDLIFQLDGINKGSDISVWTDLIGDKKFTYNNCILEDNAVSFNGVDSFARCADIIKPTIKSKATLEVVFKLEGNSDSAIFFPTGDGKTDNFGLGIDFLKKAIVPMTGSNFAGTYYYLQENSINNNNTISFYAGPAASVCYQNKVKVLTGSYISWSYAPNDGTFLGKRNKLGYENYFKGKIYAIRLYNRVLNTKEILQNQQIDINRFFGGVI